MTSSEAVSFWYNGCSVDDPFLSSLYEIGYSVFTVDRVVSIYPAVVTVADIPVCPCYRCQNEVSFLVLRTEDESVRRILSSRDPVYVEYKNRPGDRDPGTLYRYTYLHPVVDVGLLKCVYDTLDPHCLLYATTVVELLDRRERRCRLYKLHVLKTRGVDDVWKIARRIEEVTDCFPLHFHTADVSYRTGHDRSNARRRRLAQRWFNPPQD